MTVGCACANYTRPHAADGRPDDRIRLLDHEARGVRPGVREPGIRRARRARLGDRGPPSIGSIFHSYNALLDEFAGRDDLEALVLVHQDAEIIDADFCATIVREALRDPEVGVVGCVGAVGVRSIAWWEASVTLASFINRYEEHGGGDLPSFSWAWSEAPAYARLGEVETLDGFVMVARRRGRSSNVRFDESLGRFHGYDLDFCLQVRAAGRKVVTADFRAIHHRQLEMVPDPEEWIDAHMKVAEKWDGAMGIGGGSRQLEGALVPRRGRDRRAHRARLHERDRAPRRGSWSSSARWTRPPAASRGGSPRRCAACWARSARPATSRERCGGSDQACSRSGLEDDLRSAGDGMIAFACAITSGEAYRRFAEPGVELGGRAGLRRLRLRRGPADRAHLQPDPRRRPRPRRSRGARASSTRIPRSSIPASARRSAPRSPTRTSAWSDAPGANGVRSIAWWEGRW